MNAFLRFLEPNELTPASEGTPQHLATLEGLWPHQIPEDHLDFLRTYGFYNGALMADGAQVMSQFRLFNAETILEEFEYSSEDLDIPDVLPIGGQDAWLECLTPSGHYVTIDMGAGGVVDEWDAATLRGFLAERVADMQKDLLEED